MTLLFIAIYVTVGFINKGLDNKRNITLSIINMQIAMELALKSSIVENFGIKTVLVEKQSILNECEIEKLFWENKLKVKEYESLKNFTKTVDADNLYNFEKSQYKFMERFQNYRNQILHSSYVFSEDENKVIEQDIIYVLIIF